MDREQKKRKRFVYGDEDKSRDTNRLSNKSDLNTPKKKISTVIEMMDIDSNSESDDNEDNSDAFTTLTSEQQESILAKGKSKFISNMRTNATSSSSPADELQKEPKDTDKSKQDEQMFEQNYPLEYTTVDMIMTTLTTESNSLINSFFNQKCTMDILRFVNLFMDASTFSFQSIILLNADDIDIAFRVNVLNYVIVFKVAITEKSETTTVNRNLFNVPLSFVELFRPDSNSVTNFIKQHLRVFISNCKIRFVRYTYEQLSKHREHSSDRRNRWYL